MAETTFRGLNAIMSAVLSVHTQREACKTGSELIQVEHLILGVLNAYPAKATAFARKLNLVFSDISSELALHIAPAEASRVVIGDLPPSQKMLGVLGKALNYTRQSGHEFVDVSHYLFVAANEEERHSATDLIHLENQISLTIFEQLRKPLGEREWVS